MGAWYGQINYIVRFLRVWYRSRGPPRYEQRFTQGENQQPEEFPPRPMPDVNKFQNEYHEHRDGPRSNKRFKEKQLYLLGRLATASEVKGDYYIGITVAVLLVCIFVKAVIGFP